MPATDTLRRPQAKMTFRASTSFLIWKVLSMREVSELCSDVIICNTKHRDKICKFLYSKSWLVEDERKSSYPKLYKQGLPLATK